MKAMDLFRYVLVAVISCIVDAQLVSAQDSRSTRNENDFVILSDGSVKSREEVEVIDVVIAPVPIAGQSDTGALLVGLISPMCGRVIYLVSGYLAAGVGSYSPSGLTGGQTVDQVVDNSGACGGARFSLVSISGFSTNPSIKWLVSATCNGVTNAGSGGSFSYNGSGIATWVWTQQFGFVSKRSTSVSCTLVHD